MKYFGTDGIRGKVNSSPMIPEMVLKLGMAIASVLKDDHGRNMVLIGKDTRLSGYMIESALTSGLCAKGVNVTLVGPIPTPAVAFLTRTLRLDAGIVISASHNPFYDNGIKIFSSEGYKLPDKIEGEIEARLDNPNFPKRRAYSDKIGKAFRLDDATGRYIEYVKSTIPKGSDLEGMKIVVDCANGSAYKCSPLLFKELGADVISINDKPDGININERCGALYPEGLRQVVLNNNYHVGVAHDGDADRTILIDEKGNIIDGDIILGICAVELKKKKTLKGNVVVATTMSNLGLERFLDSHGIKLIRTKVGDRYVVEEMLKLSANLGGEQSGHIVFSDFNTTGDGMLTALQVLHIINQKGKPLSELSSSITLYPQLLVNIETPNKNFKTIPEIKRVIENAEMALKGRGRLLVRASGTEPKIRVMVEADEISLCEKWANEVSGVIKSCLCNPA
ncbi:MAG: phosphoglucosamine mutase [Thermodesulfovibrionales bacterium]|nr:phosphoglucosamine mutase [Thermodesulfovibrionales bacterium]